MQFQSVAPSNMLESTLQSRWYAVFTFPQNEKAVARNLELRAVENFVPSYEKESVWKNRQRVNLTLPLFPAYLFARIGAHERSKVLSTPGVIRIIGTKQDYLPIPDREIELLKESLSGRRVQPYRKLVGGARVRIKSGALKGVEGTLVRIDNSPRLVLTVSLINQHAAVEIDIENIEPVDHQHVNQTPVAALAV